MSRLKNIRNPIQRFGRQLPTVNIERVYIKDGVEWATPSGELSATTEGLNITVNLHFENIDAQPPEEFIEEYDGDIFIYAALIIGNREIDNIIRKGDKIISYLKSSLTGDSETAYQISGSSWADDFYIYKNYSKISLSDFENIGESYNLGETEGNPIYRYQASMDLSMAGSSEKFSDLFADAYVSDDNEATYKNATLFCFSSYYDLEPNLSPVPWELEADLFGTTEEDSSARYYFSGLTDMKMSSLAYEEVFEDGNVADGPRIRYTIAGTKQIYSNIPVRDISGRYRGAPEGYHDILRETFNTFVDLSLGVDGRVELLVTEDGPTADLLDNIFAVTYQQYENPGILIELNKLRQSWPNKNTATPVGRLYNAFTKILEQINIEISNMSVLERKVFENYKIIDYRTGAPTEDYSPPDTTEEVSFWFSRTQDRLYDEAIFARIGFDYDDDAEIELEDLQVVVNKGVFFFDYEKGLYNDTNIAKVLDTARIENIFGKSFLNATYNPYRIYYWRRAFDEEEWEQSITTYFTASLDEEGNYLNYQPTVEYTSYEYNESRGYMTKTYYPGAGEPDAGVSEVKERSYLLPRNIVPSNGYPDYEDYRLLAIESNDIQAGSTASDTALQMVMLTMTDNTLQALSALTSSYYDNYIKLQEYYTSASDECNYNKINFVFNDFFVDNIKAPYVGNEVEAPWNRAPVIYSIHLDLLYGLYGGDHDQIVSSAKKIISLINPDTGTLPELQAFLEKYESLWGLFYESGTDFTDIVDALSPTTHRYVNRWLHNKQNADFASMTYSEEDYGDGVDAIYYAGDYTAEEDFEADIEADYNSYLKSALLSWATRVESARSAMGASDYSATDDPDAQVAKLTDSGNVGPELIGELKDLAKEYADQFNDKLTAAGLDKKFPIYASAFKDLYAQDTSLGEEIYNDYLHLGAAEAGLMAASVYDSELGAPHDRYVKSMWAWGD